MSIESKTMSIKHHSLVSKTYKYLKHTGRTITLPGKGVCPVYLCPKGSQVYITGLNTGVLSASFLGLIRK